MSAFDRRKVLRGMLNGAAVTVGLPFFDCVLNSNGTALADGTELPVVFGTWVQGLGFNPGFWEPKVIGPNYENNIQFKALDPFKKKINIFSGMKVFLDGKAATPHQTGFQVSAMGDIPTAAAAPPSIDSLIVDSFAGRTRFRSLEVSCDGSGASWSRRGGNVVNPSETSPAALYARIFGPDFKDPNAATFTPDPLVMAKRSALSAVGEQRASLIKALGASDKARLDQYFTSLREVEQQLEVQLQKPAPLAACSVPSDPKDAVVGAVIDDVLTNGSLFAKLLAHALACGQTRAINVSFGGLGVRRQGSTMTFHMYTHEEAVDEKLGYQPNVAWLQDRCLAGFVQLLSTLESISEGDRTLLDRMLIYYFMDNSYARLHTLDNLPMMTAGGANGRLKTGHHIASAGEPVTRVGLTIQQALGVSTGSWGVGSNRSTKPISEIMA